MDNIVEKKSLDFAIRIVNLGKYLQTSKNEYIMSKQVIKAGTSIGANVAEAQYAQSNNDFVSKLSIARKETNETKYWLKLLYETEYISDKEYASLFSDIDEIHKILSSIILSAKENQNNE